ncbi:hypothetical protein BKK52_03255 [Rodentibacter trehalosifermentans]|uniref:Uncharacterized protein n=1 Tax=Rodentibacter trehalosifermentans TaxID=1908263 RepID=A0A1V3J3F6_9PAST|nr:hypothetical protein [Rodentibacter trehalosifermentans]OOF49544.1 hypothetical protein BKK52_03255 [Rodentibacter trehalosifermentans]
MSFFSKIWKFFSNLFTLSPIEKSESIEAISKLPQFDEIEMKKMEQELDLTSQARKLGEKNIPSSSDHILSGIESSIRSEIERYRAKCASWRDSRINIQDKNLTDLVLQVKGLTDNALLIKESFTQKVNDLLSQRKIELDEVEQSFSRAKKELCEFRQKHRIDRDPIKPSGGKYFFMIMLLLALIIVEGVANAYFFAQGSDGGLIGGFIQAGMFAFVNVTLACVQGRYSLPFFNHRNMGLKLLGILAWIICLSLIITVALGVSHYRDAMALDVENTAKIALNHFISSPFTFNDINSWVLCAVTCIFGIAAAFDGLYLNDPYPFYGKTDARYKDKRDEYDSLINELKEEIEEFKEEALMNLDNYEKLLRNNLVQQDKIINDKIHTHSVFEHRMEHAQTTLQGLVQKFRNENAAYRTTPAPLYFQKEIELKKIDLQAEFDPNHDRDNLDKSEQKANEFFTRIADFKAEINRTFNQQFDHLNAIYDMKFNGGLNE